MKTILIILLFLLAITCQAQMSKAQFYDSLNRIRVEKGLYPLRRSAVLEIRARTWLGVLHNNQMGMVHDNETDDGEVLTDSYDYLTWWMDSPAHRRVLLSKHFKKIGVSELNGVWCARLD